MDCIHLSETHTSELSKIPSFKNFEPISSPSLKSKSNTLRGGNLVFVKKYIFSLIRKIYKKEWGIILRFANSVIMFTYFVPFQSRYFCEKDFEDLDSMLQLYTSLGLDIHIIGDQNARFGNLENAFHKSYTPNVDTYQNENAEYLKCIFTSYGIFPINHLCMSNFCFKGDFTFRNRNGESQVDFLFTNKVYNVQDFDIVHEGLLISDHKILTCEINLNELLNAEQIYKWAADCNMKGYISIKPPFSVKSEINYTLFREKLTELVANLDLEGITNHEEAFKIIHDTLSQACNSSKINPNNPPLENSLETELLRQEVDHNLTALENGMHQNLTHSEIYNLRNDWWSSRNTYLSHMYDLQQSTEDSEMRNLDSAKFWKKIDWNNKDSHSKVNKPPVQEQYDFLKDLYSPDNTLNPINSNLTTDVYIPLLDNPIDPLETDVAIKESKKGGFDFPSPIFKLNKDILIPILTIIFNIIFFGNYPHAMAISMLHLIPKSGNLNLMTNWRGIQSLNGIAELYDRIIANRIKMWMNIDCCQSAYQKNCSCLQQVFILRTLIEIAKKLKVPLYVAFVDLEKVYDKVDRVKMLQSLIHKGIGRNMLRALINMYGLTVCFIMGIGELQSTSGIRQGATSSCYIFIIFMNDIIDHINEIFGIDGFLNGLNILVHADDALILATSHNKLVDKLNALDSKLNSMSLKMNLGKSKFMCFGNEIEKNKNPIIISTGSIKYTNKMKYLGCFFADSGNLNECIKLDYNGKISDVKIKLNRVLHNNEYLCLKSKCNVLDSCFTSSVIFGAETWGNYTFKDYETLYNYAVKAVLGVRISTPNVIAFSELKPKPISSMIYSRQWSFYNNMTRKPHISQIIETAKQLNIPFIKHYESLKTSFSSKKSVSEYYDHLFYNSINNKIMYCNETNTKLLTYRNILLCNTLNDNVSLTWKFSNSEYTRLLISRYFTGSHTLHEETGRWTNTPRDERICSLCSEGIETLDHFLFKCIILTPIRMTFVNFPDNLAELLTNPNFGNIIIKLHQKRNQYGR